MMAQYQSIKDRYPDAILFYRMGDFYEMFHEDAVIASRVLELALTSRNKKADEPVDMCGFPVRAVDGYIARLMDQGYKIAICEQVENPAEAKGLVKRDVVRVITPGMIVDNQILDEKTNNYIISVTLHNHTTGLASLDISTGRFRITEAFCCDQNPDAILIDEILRISPSEAVLPESFEESETAASILKALDGKSISYVPDTSIGYQTGYRLLTEQFNTRSLQGFGCEDMRAGVAAAGVLLSYVLQTQKQQVTHLTGVESYHLGHYLIIDSISRRNLEILQNLRSEDKTGTLLSVLDHTVTAMGGRLLKDWLKYPLLDKSNIESRLTAVEEAKQKIHLRRSLRNTLKSMSDIERLNSKIAMGRAHARDLLALKRSLQTLPEIQKQILQFDAPQLQSAHPLDTLHPIVDLIEQSIREDAPPVLTEGGLIKNGFNTELDELLQISHDGKGWLARLETKERQATGISSLKVKYNKVFGYFIEVSKAAASAVPEHYIRKQTLVNSERYITDELKSFESRVLGAEERRASLEYELFNNVRQKILRYHAQLTAMAHFAARLDCLLNLAEIADQYDYCRPQMNTDGNLYIEEGRHPVVETMVAEEQYIPNTIRMDDKQNQILIITGPNMAGKSTVLRQVALIVLMTQIGSFVPARQASVCLTDRIFTRVGALDNLSQGQSTFMVEMEETANIMNNATCRSLIVMDEIGRGTSTFDGLSIAWAVAEFLHDLEGKGVKTLFATHYHELTELALTRSRVRNFNIAVKEQDDRIIFLRKLVEGGTNRSYGIQVAQLAGIPKNVIQRAKEVLSDIEQYQKNSHFKHHRSLATQDSLPDETCQATLFETPEREHPFTDTSHYGLNHSENMNDNNLVARLNEIDISIITPLEALNLLDKLKKEAQTIS